MHGSSRLRAIVYGGSMDRNVSWSDGAFGVERAWMLFRTINILLIIMEGWSKE